MVLIQRERFDKQNNENILRLRLILDEDDTIRVKSTSRLFRRYYQFQVPSSFAFGSYCCVVHRVISWKHQELLHAEVVILMTSLQVYWILKDRKTIRVVVQKYARCKRFSAQNTESEPIALLEERVQDVAVFQINGVDLAGPLYLKNEKKARIVLCTCAVYSHTFRISDVIVNRCFQSFKCFIARRGRPTIVHSDHGTNFVGAKKKLFQTSTGSKSLLQQQYKRCIGN